jgi:vWA-MoxR associated protein C-terminal domain/Trypsin-like peptidase domain
MITQKRSPAYLVRIKIVSGTGFLIAPGYVLTCAHVVLAAIGTSMDGLKENFSQHMDQPHQYIYLDFPVIASGERIETKVVAWLPYQPEKDDIAILKLLSPEKKGIKPIPLKIVKWSDETNDQHSIYGFGGSQNIGGQSNAYQTKSIVAGGRFQLWKFGDIQDETIQAGFSGSPVWNNARECVIGMVVAAKKLSEKNTEYHSVYAIPTEVLQPVMKRVQALRLHDILAEGLNSVNGNQLQVTIATALRSCDPNGSNDPLHLQKQLLELSTDRAIIPGWDSQLIRFAVMLARMDGIRENILFALKDWVTNLCGCNYPILLAKIIDEMAMTAMPTSNICQNLMVVVEKTEASIDELRISMWAVGDRSTYNPYNPPSSIVQGGEICTMAGLPKLIHKNILKLSWSSESTIHLFLPRVLFSSDVEMQHCNKFEETLGSEHLFVIRTNKKTEQGYLDDWNRKWQSFENDYDDLSKNVLKFIDCAKKPRFELFDELRHVGAAVLKNWNSWNSVGDFLEEIDEEKGWALPVVLWSRDLQFQDDLFDMLDGNARMLKDRIKQQRIAANRSETNNLLGHHLGLIWEDPKILPPSMLPDMQFNYEAG